MLANAGMKESAMFIKDAQQTKLDLFDVYLKMVTWDKDTFEVYDKEEYVSLIH